MFCKNCGKELTSEAKFCASCGTSVAETTQEKSAQQTANHASFDVPLGDMEGYFVKGDKSKTTTADFDAKSQDLDELLGSKAFYYKYAFQQIRTTGVVPFNWASLWLSLPHSAYRGMWRIWLGELKLPILLTLLGTFMSIFGWISSFFALVTLGGIVSVVAHFWFLIAQLLYAKQFNVMYMHRVDAMLCGEISSEKVTDYKRVFVSLGIAIGLGVVLSLLEMLAM